MLWQHGWGPRITGYSSWLTSTPDGLGLHSFYSNTQCWSNLRSFHHQIQLTKSTETVCWRALVPAFGLGQSKQKPVHSPFMEEVFIYQISREQRSARYKKDLPILPNNHMVLFPWFTKYTDQNSLACEAQHLHLPPYLVTQDHTKDSKSPIPEKSYNTSTYRRALEPVLRARSTDFALEPALKLAASSALTTAFRVHKGLGTSCAPMWLLQTLSQIQYRKT